MHVTNADGAIVEHLSYFPYGETWVQNLAIEYDYDFNRLIKIRYPIFTANNVSYTYGNADAAGNANGNRAGRVTMVADASGTEERFYGPLGETIKEVKTLPGTLQSPSSSGTYITEYVFDTWNRLKRMTYPDGSSDREVLTYTYNSGGLVTSAAGKKAKFNYTYLAELDYDKFGQRVSMTLGNGVTTTYTYAADNRRLAQLQSQLPTPSSYQFQNLQYTYDAVGNITQLVNAIEPASGKGNPSTGSGTKAGANIGGPSKQNFTYDDLYRLTAATGTYLNAAGATNTYALAMAYNSIHNIVSKNQLNEVLGKNGKTSTISPTTYTLANVYESGKPHAASANGEYTLRYDANGNLIKRDAVENGHSRQLIWDEENRLACTRNNQQGFLPQTPGSCMAQGNSNAPTFTYDAAGVRVAKNGGPLSLTINQHYSEKQNSAYKHIFVGTQRLVTKLVGNNSKKIEDAQWYYNSDHLSSTSYVTDADGEIVEHLAYFPYGETWVQEKSSLPIAYQFTAKELDEETGYYYFGARYYDPRVSTWVSADPALGEYLPTAKQLAKDGHTFDPGKLPGIGGVYNSRNLTMRAYGQLNPLGFKDPDGRLDYPVNINNSAFTITSMPGNRTNPTNPSAGTESHAGTDISMGTGNHVHSVGAGVVIAAGNMGDSGYGKYVVVAHYDKVSDRYVATLYGHNSSVSAKVGDKVTEGQTIARSGNTGRSTGPHSHFEVRMFSEMPTNYQDFAKGDIRTPQHLSNFGNMQWDPAGGKKSMVEKPSNILNRIINKKAEFAD